MEQRRLRLGDILDDYCPRERRVTNHAVVAMIQEDVKQTRCTTCDAEHVYKGGKAPRRRKAESTGVLYKEVLAGLTDQADAAPAASVVVPEAAEPEIDEPLLAIPSVDTAVPEETVETVEPVMADADPEDDDIQPDMPTVDEGPVHRQLIRAQLPRVEGVKAERQAPEFTIRGNNGRGAQGFRGANGGGRTGRQNAGNGSGNNGGRFGRGPQRGGGQGFGRGPGGGGQQRPGGGGPRRRGR